MIKQLNDVISLKGITSITHNGITFNVGDLILAKIPCCNGKTINEEFTLFSFELKESMDSGNWYIMLNGDETGINIDLCSNLSKK